MEKEKYQAILRKVERLQIELMEIKDYEEDVYQAFEKLIDELGYMVEDKE